MAAIKQGNTVSIHLIGRTKLGYAFTKTPDNEPITFELGDPNILKWVQDEVMKMQVGETRFIELPPEKAYGHYNEELISKLKRSDFPPDLPLEVGQYYKVQDPEGKGPIYAPQIVRIENDDIYLDTNHPLAGQTIIFEIKLIKVSSH